MKENLLQIADEIQSKIDLQQRQIKDLDPFTKKQLEMANQDVDIPAAISVLVKHPDHEELIPGVATSSEGHIRINFSGTHPYLGTGFCFKYFCQPGLAQVGDRVIQVYLRDEKKEANLKLIKILHLSQREE